MFKQYIMHSKDDSLRYSDPIRYFGTKLTSNDYMCVNETIKEFHNNTEYLDEITLINAFKHAIRNEHQPQVLQAMCKGLRDYHSKLQNDGGVEKDFELRINIINNEISAKQLERLNLIDKEIMKSIRVVQGDTPGTPRLWTQRILDNKAADMTIKR